MRDGILSDRGIWQAVRNQRRYESLRARSCLSWNNGGLSFVGRLHMAWLKRQPRIHIDNFSPVYTEDGGSLGPNSYDLKLSEKLKIYEFGCLSDTGPNRDSPFLDMRKATNTKEIVIPPDGMVLKPGTLYLGCTVEHTETYNLVAYIDGRSSCGRLGLFTHITAGAADRAFQGRFTLELAVIHPLKVYANTRICQIRFHTIGAGRDYAGRYQHAPTGPVASLLHT